MFQSHMRFCRIQWLPTRFYGSLSAYSRPHPFRKHSPFAAQLKIAFRRFLFIHVMTPANKPFTVKHTFFTYGSGISPLLPRSSIAVHHFSSFCSTTINISFFLKLRSSSSCGGRCKNAVRKTAHIK